MEKKVGVKQEKAEMNEEPEIEVGQSKAEKAKVVDNDLSKYIEVIDLIGPSMLVTYVAKKELL